jgi:streptogramin lyase
VNTGGYLDGIAVADGVIWATDLDGNRVVRVDAKTGHRLPDIAAPDGPLAIVADGRAVWVASYHGDQVTRFDARTGHRTAVVRSPSESPCALAVVDKTLWIVDQTDGSGVTVDATTGRREHVLHTTAHAGLATYAFGSVWVPDFAGSSDSVQRFDPATRRRTATVRTGSAPIQIAGGSGSLWVANAQSNTVARIDPRTGAVQARITFPHATPVSVTIAYGAAWVAGYGSNSLYRVDPDTNRITGSLALPGPAENIAVAAGRLWVTTTSGSLVAVTPSR